MAKNRRDLCKNPIDKEDEYCTYCGEPIEKQTEERNRLQKKNLRIQNRKIDTNYSNDYDFYIQKELEDYYFLEDNE